MRQRSTTALIAVIAIVAVSLLGGVVSADTATGADAVVAANAAPEDHGLEDAIVVEDDGTPALIGETGSVTLTVTNTGQSELSSVEVALTGTTTSDSLPDSVTIESIESDGTVDASADRVAWESGGPVSPGGTGQVTFQFAVDGSYEGPSPGSRKWVTPQFAITAEDGGGADTWSTAGAMQVLNAEPGSPAEAIAAQSDPREVTFTDVLGAIAAFNEGQQVNGFDVGFTDVLGAISTFNAGPPEPVELRETVTVENSYEVNVTADTPQGTIEYYARVHGGDMLMRWDVEGSQFEMYAVDGNIYYLTEFQGCVKNPAGDVQPVSVSPDDSEAEWPDTPPIETTSIDGEEVVVYELTDWANYVTVTYYISADTGQIQRLEATSTSPETGDTMSIVSEYSSWGEAAPIPEPDVSCTSIGTA